MIRLLNGSRCKGERARNAWLVLSDVADVGNTPAPLLVRHGERWNMNFYCVCVCARPYGTAWRVRVCSMDRTAQGAARSMVAAWRTAARSTDGGAGCGAFDGSDGCGTPPGVGSSKRYPKAPPKTERCAHTRLQHKNEVLNFTPKAAAWWISGFKTPFSENSTHTHAHALYRKLPFKYTNPTFARARA